MKTSQPKVSLCMIVKNEEANLPACLESVKGLFDEIVIVDTGSTDRTKEIALQYGAIVSDFEWIDDFSAARNKSLDLATGEWIFWLDADHRVDKKNYDLLKNLFQNLEDKKIAYEMLEVPLDPYSEFTNIIYYMRLFRRHPRVRWRYRVHEQIIPSLREAGYQFVYQDIHITHVGYSNPLLVQQKLQRNLALLEKERNGHEDDPSYRSYILFHIGRVYRGLDQMDKALATMQQALEIIPKNDPNLWQIYYELTMIYGYLKNWDESLRFCKKLLTLKPDHGHLLFLESEIWINIGNITQAQECLKSIIKNIHHLHTPIALFLPQVLHNLGSLYYQQGDEGEAEKQWLAAVETDPNFSRAWLALAKLWTLQKQWGKFTEAIYTIESNTNNVDLANTMKNLLREGESTPISSLSVLNPHRSTSSPPKISLCMIVRNEERNLGECLECVKGLFDEIVIVDTGSTDRTKEIAKQYGAIVADFPWVDDFAAARNKSIELAGGKWIFWLDADNRVDKEAYNRLQELFKTISEGNVGYLLLEVSLPASSAFPIYIYYLRLFRNHPKIRWRYPIHEQIIPSLQEAGHLIQVVDIAIEHLGYNDSVEYQRKLERNLRILEKMDCKDPATLSHVLYFLAITNLGLQRYVEALAQIQQAIEVTPADALDYSRLYKRLMEAYESLNQLEDAIKACEIAKKLRPNDADLLIRESKVWKALGNVTNAEACLLQVLDSPERYPLHNRALYRPRILHNLGHLYYDQKQFTKAEKQWLEAVQIDPHFEFSWLALAELWSMQNRWDQLTNAIEKIETQIKDKDLAEKLRREMRKAKQNGLQSFTVLKKFPTNGS